uniref:NADH dehydrogenase subunit 5 n=1 Tax=Phytomastax pentaspinula TaxID=3034359 RepID=UPI0024115524|nr:NADH dehydrogenase subunit 5 [Phytomastax pentaspinula]WEL32804.1 NADH dehydrogenase subunit 5 [Phytomastax pentaspinula]
MNVFVISNLMFFCLFPSSLITFMFGVYFLIMDMVIFIDWEIMNLNSSMVVMTLLFDWMSLLFMSFVMLISSMVIYYSTDYMSGDKYLDRFILIVFLFVVSMMFMIISPNMISILLGWDGLGLVSYLLVIYYQNVKSYNSGMLTVMSNRVGDVSILMSIAFMLNYGSWNYIYLNDLLGITIEMNMIMLLLILASMTKSAQIPFSSWLPAAMAAPTPVSALVHSSTLVTAGVYLMIRFNFILMYTGFFKVLLLFGCLTMFMAGMVANFEYDLKKIIALSTLSQLGLMMSILSMGYWKLAFFHLLTHALFKALLFLCAGSYIHNLGDFQDIRYMGSMVKQMPFTSICFNVSSLSLCGMPFLSGFYSKDLILEVVMLSWLNLLIFLLYFISTGLTAMYSLRLIYYSMLSNYNYNKSNNFDDMNYYMNFGMFGLLLFSLLSGSLLMWIMFPYPYMICLPNMLKYITMSTVFLGSYFGYMLFNYNYLYTKFHFNLITYMMGNMWFMPYLSTTYISYYILNYGNMVVKSVDYGWSEFMGGQGMYKFFIYCTNYMQWWYDSNFKTYMLYFSLWMFMLISLYML